MKNISLRHLRVFVAVARHLNFARAAEELALTGPAVSMQVKDLEDQVGLPLFDRTSRSVSLTRVGEDLLAHAQKVLGLMRDAEDMVANFKGLKSGTIDVVMFSTADHFMPRLLAMFLREHPGIEVHLHVANNREQIELLLQHREVDLAIMGRPSGEWATGAEPFAPNPLVLVTAVDHPFTRMKRVSPQALVREGFIMREPGSGGRASLERYLESHKLTARSVMQMSSDESIKHAVMAGLGISLLPLHSIGLELEHGLIAMPRVTGFPIIRRWYITHRAGKVLSPAAQAFRAFILEEGGRFLARKFPAEALAATARG